MSIPFLIYTDYILSLWLNDNLPQAVSFFAKAIILIAIIEALSGPLWMSAHAKGNIRNYQIIISIIFLFNLPLTYVLLELTESVKLAFLSTVIISFIALVYRYIYFFNSKSVDRNLTLNYFRSLFLVLLFMGGIVYGQFFYLGKQDFSLSEKIVILIFIEFIYIIYLIVFCFSLNERKALKQLVENKLTLYFKFKR